MTNRDALLEGLRAAGAVDSSGAFSIDYDEAHDKLRRFQLARPQMWLVLLTTAAVAGGASRLDVSADHSNAVVRFDGVPLDLERLAGMVASLDSVDRRLWDVACALNALSTYRPGRILIQSWDDRHAAWLAVEGDRVRFAQHEPPAARGSGTRITVLNGALDGGEFGEFTQRCAFAPLLVTYNGRPRDPWFEIQDPLLVRLIGPPFDFEYRFHTHVREAAFLQRAQGPIPAIICVGGKAVSYFEAVGAQARRPVYTWDGRPRTVFILNGQSFEIDHSLPQTLCIAAGAGLQKDLSHGALLAGGDLPERLRGLDQQFDEALVEVASLAHDVGQMRPERRQRLAQLLRMGLVRMPDNVALQTGLAHLEQTASAGTAAQRQGEVHVQASLLHAQRTRLRRQWSQLRVGPLRDLQATTLDAMRALRANTGPALELLALLEHADSRDERALSYTLEGVDTARQFPELQARLLEQAALIWRARGDRERAAAFEAQADELPRMPGSAALSAVDAAFAEGRVDEVIRLAEGAAASFLPRDPVRLDFLDALADACHIEQMHAKSLRWAERALKLYERVGLPERTERLERLDVIWELTRAARSAHPVEAGALHAASSWVRLRLSRWRIEDHSESTIRKHHELVREVEQALRGAASRDPEQARQAFLLALHRIREAGAAHLAVMQGTLWLGVRLHRFAGAFEEADRVAASLQLCRRLRSART